MMSDSKQKQRVHSLKWRIFRGLVLALLVVVILAAGVVAYVVWRPTGFIVALVNWREPGLQFTAESIHWTSRNSLQMDDARVGGFLKVPRSTLRWEWKLLWERRITELKVERPEIFVDLAALGKIGATPAPIKGVAALPQTPTWHLDHLILERGGLVMVGIAPDMPPLTLEMEGKYDDVPLGTQLSEAALQKPRVIKFSRFTIHSPLDQAVPLVSMDGVALEFRVAGLRSRELDSLVFHHPILNVDRSLFWYVDELRKVHASRPPVATSDGPTWRVKSFLIRKGQLDISRLRELSLQYPFEFEVSRKDLNLRDLSLAQFQIDLIIPRQNLFWPAHNLSFRNLHGKVLFNLGEPVPVSVSSSPDYRPPNDMVNTLYADVIEWKDFPVSTAWMSLTFDPKSITAAYGGAFARGYINGGATCGWSLDEPWRVWGAASDVETGEVFDALASQAITMNGRAGMGFDVEGHMEKLTAKLNLKSKSSGVIEFRTMDKVLERIRTSMDGVKRDVTIAFVTSLREYPYSQYDLDLTYSKPDAILAFQSKGVRGSRKLDLTWHGLQNGNAPSFINTDWSVKEVK